jgi:signal peptidase I
MHDLPHDPDPIQEPIEPTPPDYTFETIAQRTSLLRRVSVILLATPLFALLSYFDPNRPFNPVNSGLFLSLAFVVFVLAWVLFFDYRKTDPATFFEKEVYLKSLRQNSMLEFLVVLPVLMLVFTIVNMFFVSFSPISGTSMEPNFHDHEAVVFSHFSNRYERFDVIILYENSLEDPYLIKRVIGLPGETVVIDDNEIFINGERIEQDFIDTDQIKTYCRGNDINYCSFDIPSDSYFVLGDNRDGNAVASSGYSIDSRTFGPVQEDNIFGKVIWTFRDFNLLE